MGHKAVSGFLQHWISREGNGDTLTASGGQALLQKMKQLEELAKIGAGLEGEDEEVELEEIMQQTQVK